MVPKEIDLTITTQDYENSSKKFLDNFNCPLATALKRTLRNLSVSFLQINAGVDDVDIETRRKDDNQITITKTYKISESFTDINFDELVAGKEFNCKLTLIN